MSSDEAGDRRLTKRGTKNKMAAVPEAEATSDAKAGGAMRAIMLAKKQATKVKAYVRLSHMHVAVVKLMTRIGHFDNKLQIFVLNRPHLKKNENHQKLLFDQRLHSFCLKTRSTFI